MRRLLIAFLLALFFIISVAADTDTQFGTTTDTGGGTSAWTNPGNADADDISYAFTSVLTAGTSNYLSTSSLGFAIPAGSTINGVEIFVSAFVSNSAVNVCAHRNVELFANGVTGSDLPTQTTLTTSNTIYTHPSSGGATQTWALGANLTAVTVNLTTFTARIRFNCDTADDVNVDFVSVKVYYTLPTGSGRPNRMTESQVRPLRIWPNNNVIN